MNPFNLSYRLIIYLTSFALVAEFILFIWNVPAQISNATFFLSALQGDTVVVTEYTDNSDTTPGDGICDAYIVAGDQCTLRAAIEELNAQGPDVTPHVIEFNISGTGPFTIAPASALPNITVPVEIRGETQPGTTCPAANTPATLLIVLDGINAGADVDGLLLDSGSDGSTIRGLVIGNFTGDGIRIVSNDNRVRCNHVGVNVDGVSEIGNDTNGIFVAGDGNSIGGSTSPVQRNVISGNEAVGVRIDSSAENNVVVNNYIGTTADGLSGLGNSSGMYVNAHNNVIGGTNALARNVISGNNSYGIRVNTGENNIIQGNYIGVARDGTTPLPNLSNGIELLGTATSNIVGGTASGEANRIVNNGSYGVTVDENVTGVPVQNEIRGNSIFNNGNLGIDLGEDGVDINDPGDVDGGENDHQNYPVLSLVPGSTILTGTLDSQANTQYTLDLYRSSSCDSSGYGEGQQHLFTEVVTTDGSGHLEITGDLAGTVSPGNGITATATDPNGNTSEFSACVTVTSPATPTPTPTQTGTPGPSPTPTTTSTPGPSPTATATVTPGPSPTPTATPTAGPSPTAAPTLDYAVYLPFIQK